MNASKNTILLVLAGLLFTSTPVFAHIGIDSDAGIQTNLIAVGIVVFSIVMYLLISNRKRQKTTKTKE